MSWDDRQLYRYIDCYECQCYEHFSDQCPDKQQLEINLAIIGVMLMQNCDVINKTWILLNTCSTDSVTKNWIMLNA